MTGVTEAPAPPETAESRLADRLRQAFLDHGYEHMTMSALAQLCGFSRRALYHHFSNKEEAFRHFLRIAGDQSIAKGLAAGDQLLRDGGSAVEVITEVMNVRYGDARRRLSRSPHALEINDKAFRVARDIMIEAAIVFQGKVADVLVELAAHGRLSLKPGIAPATLAQSLCDGARGTNQALPPIPIELLPTRYRAIISAILYGAAEQPRRALDSSRD